MQPAFTQTSYGADASGLICAFRFLPGQPGEAVTIEDVPSLSALRTLTDEDGDDAFYWLHFNLAHAASLHCIRNRLGLPEEFFEALADGSHSTRIEQQEGALLAVINDVTFEFEFTPSEIATLWAWTHRRILVTARLKPLRSIDRLRGYVRNQETFRSAAELLVHLMRDQADVLVQIVRRASAELDRAEDRFLAGRDRADRHELGNLRRVLVRLQRMLAPEPGAIFRLLARPPRWLLGDDVQDLRESTEEFSVVLRDMAGLIERIRLLQEETAAHLEEQNNRTLFTLTLVTVLALPINIVAGVFGMNVGGIPLAENKHGFWLMVGLVVTFTALGGAWLFRWRAKR
jgi:zinc transporter